ncbi:hypothetical protein [Halobacillus sp. H74]|uniref:hypothetical protein n=1 Tax=Halobacillus sp. H74 TaxID=3457436 RepID=UPI003FCC4B9C
MVVEINLLEQKEKRNILPFIILGFFVLVSLIIVVTLGFQRSQLVAQTEAKEERIQQIQQDQEKFTQPVDNEGTERDQLKDSLDQLKATIVPTIPFVERLVSLLPERGFFESFTLTGASEVTVVARFDTIQQAAKFTNTLNQESVILNVELASVETSVVDETEDLYDYQPRYIASYYLVLNESTLLSEKGLSE